MLDNLTADDFRFFISFICTESCIMFNFPNISIVNIYATIYVLFLNYAIRVRNLCVTHFATWVLLGEIYRTWSNLDVF